MGEKRLMKRRDNKISSKLITALLMVCILGSSACSKSDDKKEETKKTTETKIEATEKTESEENKETEAPSSKDTSATEGSSETSAAPESSSDASESQAETTAEPETADVVLGAGNIGNGGFATGNSRYSFYVMHPSGKAQVTLVQEDNASGEKKELYSADSIDCLNLTSDALYFREGKNAITKVSLADGSTKKISEGQIANLTVYNDNLYYSENSCLVKTSLDGSNKTVLFEKQQTAMPADIAFCITNDKIFFSDPTDFANGGYFFGFIYSMDLDGNGKTELGMTPHACNGETFFSDGEWIYFYGDAADGSVAGYLRVKLDGKEVRQVNRYSPCSENCANGKLYMATSDGLYVLDKDLIQTQILSENIGSAKFVIVGDSIYYMDASGTKTMRVSLDGSNKVELG